MVKDPHSFARPAEARLTHVAIDLTVDFDARTLRGCVTLDLDLAPGLTAASREVVLDSRALTIQSVCDVSGSALVHALREEDTLLGSALVVTLPPGVNRIVVTYATSPDGGALQWLGPEQTAGGQHPFLFTQGHAIQSRSWLPVQDSPGIRMTYEARITVPRPLIALMSAERAEPVSMGSQSVFTFQMREPIPAYLIALAVGEVTCREIGARTAVFAEPRTLDRAAYEFAEIEAILEAAEALVGRYRWGRFDVLVMPPSFPYGGMENPRLTFVSPTLLAGDRSLVTVLVHELAHAWAGNLVVNSTWNDFWLNEGTTVYLELRLNEALWGADRAALLKSWSFRELASEIERGGATPDTRLRYDMTGRDPAEGVTVIPYLKGAALFWTLEGLVGRDRLDASLRSWFDSHAFGAVTTDMMIEHLRTTLGDGVGSLAVDLEAWVDKPGLPDVPAPTSSILDRVDAAVAAVLDRVDPSDVDVAGFTPAAWRQFLGGLRTADSDALDGLMLERLDRAFAFGASQNAEVLAPWLRLLIKASVESAGPTIEAFLRTHGRAKFLRPIVQDLLATEWGASLARRVYESQRPRYHALVRASLDKLFETPRG